MISRIIQTILCGQPTDITDVVNGEMVKIKEVRFEDHTFLSTSQLISKFIQIGNNRIKLSSLLRHDSLSYEIKKHLTKFDGYISTLSNDSPISVLTKVRPFSQVFVWFIQLLKQKSFAGIQNELLLSSQTLFKQSLSIKLYKVSFAEAARAYYRFAFLGEGVIPTSNEAFEPLRYDCLSSGQIIHFLNETIPSHPIFDLSDEFMESFLSLQNRLNEYISKCESVIRKTYNDFLKKRKKEYDKRMKEFEINKKQIRDELKRFEMKQMQREQAIIDEKQRMLLERKQEIKEFDERRKQREREERENDKIYIENLVKSKSVTPIFRPFTEEELKMIEYEKLELFKEFQAQMRELGASEEKIMSFFPDLNLPEDEIEALEFDNEIAEEEESYVSEQSESESIKIIMETKMSETEHVIEEKSIIENEEEESENEIFQEEEQLTTIPALFYRLVIPSFKQQHKLLSKALFTVLVAKEDLPKQINAIAKLFLIHPSSETSEFLQLITTIPYVESSFIMICDSFSKASESLQLKGIAHIGQPPKPPVSVHEIISNINEMPIKLQVNPVFACLLPDRIIECYISIFRNFIILQLAKEAVKQIWCKSHNSYRSKRNQHVSALSIMSRFVTCVETYIYYTALAPASKALENICDGVETIEEFCRKHETILNTLMNMSLLSKSTEAMHNALLQALTDICCFAFGIETNEKQTDVNDFCSSSSLFAEIVHGLSAATANNQVLKCLDTLFSDFLK
ncbi:hypothetical protein GPJ56_000766 [Histomonas meleagridis]|uniref:uncharacterized protein n=1 Tax=Histomonas meleagridis TaxID=135588 RepID=UPI003559E6A1|nr:hypothetical protein GPJ56_000766 [Histomonas meleagridis]KAH0804475.1 hypothetical protein GO595_003305 [Histomonas meleagridis]